MQMHFTRSKTLWFSAILAVLGAMELHSALLRDLVGAEHFGAVMLAISVVTAVLRVVTTQPLSEK